MNDLTAAAVTYLEAGLHLLALTQKRPNPKYHGKTAEDEVGWSWEKSIWGVPETDEERAQLAAVFEDPSTTGVAILIPEHCLVADIDTEEAANLFAELTNQVWPDTVVAKTPKGLHVWFVAPGANGTVWVGDRVLLFKGFGGYVAAPPSRHFNQAGVEDGVYTWVEPYGSPMDFLPDGIATRMRTQKTLDAMKPVKTAEGGVFLGVPVDDDGRWTGKGWAGWHLEGLARAIREAPDGNQNNMIAWAAMQARDEGVPLEAAMKTLLAAAIEGNHPARRARTTIRGAYSRRPRG